MERLAGIEPTSIDWKSIIIPLYDNRICIYIYICEMNKKAIFYRIFLTFFIRSTNLLFKNIYIKAGVVITQNNDHI